MKIKNYRSVNKGALKGFATIFVDKWGIEISDMGIFEKEGKKWISFPQKTYEKDGKTCYFPYIKFIDASIMKRFTDEVLRELDAWISANPVLAPQEHKDKLEEELPF